MNLIERLWCKLFHVWDNYEYIIKLKEIDLREESSSYITKFCPICQKCRFKLKSKSKLRLLIEWNK